MRSNLPEPAAYDTGIIMLMQQRLPKFSSAEISSKSPCSGYCTTVLGDDVCRNCLRTFEEVTRWVEMSEEERRSVNLRIALEQWELSIN